MSIIKYGSKTIYSIVSSYLFLQLKHPPARNIKVMGSIPRESIRVKDVKMSSSKYIDKRDFMSI